MRGVQMKECLRTLRAEIGHSTDPAVGMNVEDALKALLERTQMRLWEEWDWSHLRVRRDISLSAGQRFYNVPADVPFERILSVSVRDGSRWKPLCYGITPEDFNIYDPDLNQRSYPPRKYFVTEDPADTAGNIDAYGMIEVWPLPDRNANAETLEGILRLEGIRSLRRFSEDNDRCELDHNLIILYSAAEYLAREKAEDAQHKLAAAQQLKLKLQGSTGKIKTWKLGIPEDSEQWPYHPTYVNRSSR